MVPRHDANTRSQVVERTDDISHAPITTRAMCGELRRERGRAFPSRIVLFSCVLALGCSVLLMVLPERGNAQEEAPSRVESVALTYRAVAFWNQASAAGARPFALPSDRQLRQHAYPADTPDAPGDVFAGHHILHSPGWPDAHGPQGLLQRVAEYRAAFPDLRLTVVDLIVDGNGVAIRWRAHGTHRGAFQGVRASGVVAAWEGLALFRIADGRVAETWFYPDTESLLHQLRAA